MCLLLVRHGRHSSPRARPTQLADSRSLPPGRRRWVRAQATCGRRRSSPAEVVGAAAVASSSETSTISLPRTAAIRPQVPARASSAAFSPRRVARSRSRAVGVPPRWTCPSTVTRVSNPVSARSRRRRRARSRRGARTRTRSCSWTTGSSCSPGAPCERVALGDDDDREVPARASCRRRMWSHASSIAVGSSGTRMTSAPPATAARGCDPARVPAHDLDDHDPVVRLGGRVQSVDRLGADVDGRVEADRDVGPGEVVVDRLRHADDRVPVLDVRGGARSERALASDRDDAVDLQRRASSRGALAHPTPRETGRTPTFRGSSRRAGGSRRRLAA